MIVTLRCFFGIVLASMLAVTLWAGSHVAVWSIPGEIGSHPWFIATLFDAYWGFLTFYAWQWYKEPSSLSRTLWLIALVLLGNIAMATYGLLVTWRLPRDAKPEALLLRGQPLSPWVPAILIGTIVAVGLVAARREGA